MSNLKQSMNRNDINKNSAIYRYLDYPYLVVLPTKKKEKGKEMGVLLLLHFLCHLPFCFFSSFHKFLKYLITFVKIIIYIFDFFSASWILDNIFLLQVIREVLKLLMVVYRGKVLCRSARVYIKAYSINKFSFSF